MPEDFSGLGLSAKVTDAVAAAGYTKPTEIQAQAIPYVLEKKDIIGIAQTGTGKTASFVLPMLTLLESGRARARMPRTLILEPTRELAAQVAENFEKYGKNHRLTMALLIGGVSFEDQNKVLDRGADVLIATPGRMLDQFERGRILLSGVDILVIDEADRMLDMGFIPDIERIFKLTPPKKQTLFFSATMPPEITRLTKQFLKDPIRIEATPPATTATTITQHIARIGSSDPKAKRTVLRALVGAADVRNGIVFCNRKSEVDVVAKSLKVHGFDAAPIHGDLDQSQRMKTLADFRNGDLKLLVASDVAARGLDIPDVSHVFNYDVPHHADDYVHRIGRTGRAGRKGDAYMIVTPADSRSLDKVLKLIGQAPEEVKLDIDLSGAVSEDRPRRGGERSRGGSKDRERPARGERRPRREEEAPAAETAAPAEEQPEAVAAEPRQRPRREDRSRREDRPARSEPAEARDHAERDQRSAREEQSGREDRHRANR